MLLLQKLVSLFVVGLSLWNCYNFGQFVITKVLSFGLSCCCGSVVMVVVEVLLIGLGCYCESVVILDWFHLLCMGVLSGL